MAAAHWKAKKIYSRRSAVIQGSRAVSPLAQFLTDEISGEDFRISGTTVYDFLHGMLQIFDRGCRRASRRHRAQWRWLVRGPQVPPQACTENAQEPL